MEHSSWAKTPQNQRIGDLAFMGKINFEKPLGESKKPISFIPYFNGITGRNFVQEKSLNNFEYGLDMKVPIGNSINVDLTFNPDFSQVEADATKIDINSPTAINYPEKRPFFNRGIDAMDYSLDVFNSRAINNPSFAGKILNQGKKSRLYLLSAFDEETPYLVPTQYESFSGVGGKSFSNIIRYQNFE